MEGEAPSGEAFGKMREHKSVAAQRERVDEIDPSRVCGPKRERGSDEGAGGGGRCGHATPKRAGAYGAGFAGGRGERAGGDEGAAGGRVVKAGCTMVTR